MQYKSNKLYVVTAPSGSGKTTIMRSVMDSEIIWFTTRQKRDGEVEGKDYIFITREEFDELLLNNGLIENTCYGGNYYGVTRSEFENKLSQADSFFIADYNGMQQIREFHENTTTIFIHCDKERCKQNMLKRGDKVELVEKRLSTYENEIQNSVYFDHLVFNNGSREDVIKKVNQIIRGE